MAAGHLIAQGVVLDASAMSPRLRAFANAVVGRVDARFVRALKHGEAEGLELSMRVERPQRPAYPLQAEEPILLVWETADELYPTAIPIRAAFPMTPHRSIVARGEIPGLCLFERGLDEVRSTLTPARFLSRVGHWLDRAAMGELHAPGQRLEPFVLGAAPFVCHESFFSSSTALVLVSGIKNAASTLYFAHAVEDSDFKRLIDKCQFVPLMLKCQPTDGTIVQRYPRDFGDLAGLLAGAGVDLDREVRTASLRLMERDQRLLGKSWIFLLDLPKTREGAVEGHDYLAFALLDVTIGDLGVHLGDLGRPGKVYGALLQRVSQGTKRDVGTPVALNPVFVLTPERARQLSGLGSGDWGDRRLVCIGAGALGSQVVMNLARQGISRWSIVDRDYLLPHNLARHALDFSGIGGDKAGALARSVRSILDVEDGVVSPLTVDVVGAKNQADFAAHLKPPAVILDLSASRAVLQHLAPLEVRGPIMTAYLTGRGEHLVAMGEGAQRALRLDDLDIEFAAAAAFDPALSAVFGSAAETVRYGGACGDMSAVLPQSLAAFSAAIVAERAIPWIREQGEAWVACWKINRATQEAVRCSVELLAPPAVRNFEMWQLRVSQRALEGMRRFREEALPNETCGVLVGALDLVRHVAYVARALPPPADSVLSPTECVRGNRDLREALDALHARSGNVLTYVGEWHSHPRGATSQPSVTDLAAYARLMTLMAAEGLPTVMLVQAEGSDFSTLFASPVSAPALSGTQ